MPERKDLLVELRALEARYAQASPGPQVEARIREKMRGQAGKRERSRLWAAGFALAASALLFALVAPRACSPSPEEDALAPEREDEPLLVREKLRAAVFDGGPPERRDAPRRVRSVPVIPRAIPEDRPAAPREPESPAQRRAPSSVPRTNEPVESETRRWPSGDGLRDAPRDAPRDASGDVPREGRRGFAAEPRGLGPGLVLPGGGAAIEPEKPALLSGSVGSSPPSANKPSAPSGGRTPPSAKPPAKPPFKPPAKPPEALPCYDMSELKTHAYDQCKAEGLILIDLIYLDACGDGRYRRAEAKCAEPSSDPGPDAGPAPECITLLSGDGTTCQSPTVLKDLAIQACSDKGLTVSYLSLSQDCADGNSRYAKYMCCTDVLPPPCVEHLVGDGWTCADAPSLEALGKSVCDAEGMFLTQFGVIATCPQGNASAAKLVCCQMN